MRARLLFWRLVSVLLVALALAGAIALAVWYELERVVPQQFDSPVERFKYGSIGTEEEEGVPYWVWFALPRVFPDLLVGSDGKPRPGGYEALGVVWEEGKEMPVGFSKKTIGFPRVGINCALCHSGSYRTAPDQAAVIVPGAPAARLDVLAYQRFLFACASDPRFTADNLLPAIEYATKLSPVDKLLYRYGIIPQTRAAILKTKERFAWTSSRPDWGRGRIDPFNPVKFHQLKMDPSRDNSIGNSDMEPLWNRAARKGHSMHWDGLNDDLTEVVMSGAVGDGATAKTLPYADLQALEQWLQHLPSPAYPFPIDPVLAAKGGAVFRKQCSDCHAAGGKRTGTVIPLAEIQTDRHRIDMWSQAAADIYNRMPLKPPFGFQRFQKHEGYVATPLDGLWIRAPYLHNGSVPTLEDLLEPADKRPKVFFRGYDVFDRTKVGFESSGPAAEGAGFRYDTAVPGNGNGGHDGPAHGTTLPPDDKRALVEFLKTL